MAEEWYGTHDEAFRDLRKEQAGARTAARFPGREGSILVVMVFAVFERQTQLPSRPVPQAVELAVAMTSIRDTNRISMPLRFTSGTAGPASIVAFAEEISTNQAALIAVGLAIAMDFSLDIWR